MEPAIKEFVKQLVVNNTKKMMELKGNASAETITELVITGLALNTIAGLDEQIDEALKQLISENEIVNVKGNYYPTDPDLKKTKVFLGKKPGKEIKR